MGTFQDFTVILILFPVIVVLLELTSISYSVWPGRNHGFQYLKPLDLSWCWDMSIMENCFCWLLASLYDGSKWILCSSSSPSSTSTYRLLCHNSNNETAPQSCGTLAIILVVELQTQNLCDILRLPLHDFQFSFCIPVANWMSCNL
jgi:hypothetical protein